MAGATKEKTDMSWIIDGVLVLIILYFIWRGYRNGIILGVLGVLTIIIAFAAANIVANTYSSEFTGMLSPFMSGVVDSAANDNDSNDLNGDGVITPDEMSDVYTFTFNTLRKLGVSESASDKIAVQMTERVDVTTSRLTESLSNYLCEKLSFLVVFVVVFILVAIIFAAIGNVINLAFSLPGLETFNHVAGAVLGLAKGALLLLFISCVFRYLGLLIPNGTLDDTILMKWLMDTNYIADIIGL